MRVLWDVPIGMDDGLILRSDVFLPLEEGNYPVLLSYGPYAKGLHFEDGYPDQWRIMCEEHPDVPANSTNIHANWEVVDPEKWCPHGYACVRVDSRGAGRSPGYIQHFSPRETQDFYDCIEWAGVQDWSNGKVGITGISYYAMNQWQVASMQPPHLAAMCSWEGAADWYRDSTHHGGMLSTFWANWYGNQVESVQFGLGDNGPKSRATGMNVCGDVNLSQENMAANRCDFGQELRDHATIDDSYYSPRLPQWDKIEVPLLSSGNWGGHGLHLRGNTEGYFRSASKQKWLEMHGIEHWTHFYTDYGREIQLAFFDHFLRGIDNGWDKTPAAILNIRHPNEKFVLRYEQDWPLPDTQWTKLHLDPVKRSLSTVANTVKGTLEYDALREGVTFTMVTAEDTEITGPLAAKLHVSSSTPDADLFLIFKVFDPDGTEVTYQGALDPHTPIAHGWLRASHRKLDPELSLPFRPFHTHDEKQLLTPDEIYELDIEIWPTCIVVPAGWTIALTIQGSDYQYSDNVEQVGWFTMTGVGPFKHDDPSDRPKELFDGKITLHFGAERESFVLVPIIPPR
ncbi:MAG TPA: peptidase S15 [Gammaproteobacteria bacterium]|nr:peptidase S15 [Gammaproteobacteria bacterium]